eukprot:5222878-Ditylum_brightwellii.AAC.1
MLQTERKMPKLPDFWWSPELHTKHLICQYWRIEVSSERNRLHNKNMLEEIRQQLPTNTDDYQGDANHPTIYQ